MNFQNLKDEVCEEAKKALTNVNEQDLNKLINSILSGKKVFVVAVGRVMLVMQSFAKRLKHLSIDAHVVGEIVEPPITKGDILIVGSGSGETMIPVNMARLAKKLEAKVGLITSSMKSTLKKLADVSVTIPCPTKLHLPDEPISKQPMANLFEQSLFVFCDCLTFLLQEKLGITKQEMWKAHANLE